MLVPLPPVYAEERHSRKIPPDVKIAVSERDQGMCVQCGSREDLHYDHKIPPSNGESNTMNNSQPLCGRCNRINGADDIAPWQLKRGREASPRPPAYAGRPATWHRTPGIGDRQGC
jgi:5-methylcytosine-specific restriction endonuclease McrA